MILKIISKHVYPESYNKSIFSINYNKLYEENIKILLFDLDNTIAEYKDKTPSQEVIDLFNELKNRFKIILVSNSPKVRVSRFAGILDVDFIHSTYKPLKFKIKKRFKKLKICKKEVILIGDQLLTDMFVSNRLNIRNILVKPLNRTNEFKSTRFNRKIEKRILMHCKKRNLEKYNKALYYYETGEDIEKM